MFKKILLGIFMILTPFILNFSNISYSADGIDEAFETAKKHLIVKEEFKDGKVTGWVGNTMRLMLKITIMIGIAVFLFGGIKFMLSMGDDSKAKKTRDNLLISALGFIIAFGAWAILQLILSVGTTIRTEILFYII